MDVRTDRSHRGSGEGKKAMNFSTLRYIAFFRGILKEMISKVNSGNVDDPI